MYKTVSIGLSKQARSNRCAWQHRVDEQNESNPPFTWHDRRLFFLPDNDSFFLVRQFYKLLRARNGLKHSNNGVCWQTLQCRKYDSFHNSQKFSLHSGFSGYFIFDVLILEGPCPQVPVFCSIICLVSSPGVPVIRCVRPWHCPKIRGQIHLWPNISGAEFTAFPTHSAHLWNIFCVCTAMKSAWLSKLDYHVSLSWNVMLGLSIRILHLRSLAARS